MRPYIENNKRVVISNISPVIPNEIVLDALKKKGIIPVSQISNVRAGLHKPGRSHIISFRRQMYIKYTDEEKLPESIQINYDSTTYWIYMSTNSTNCFVCKQSGHVAKLFPQAINNTHDSQLPIEVNPILLNNTENLNSKKIDNTNRTETNLALKRRTPPSTISSDELQN